MTTSVDINLTGRAEQCDQPWLWRLCREFNIQVNVVKASIEPDYGWVQVRLDGPIEEIQRATAWLMTTGLHVDTVQRSMGVPS